MLNFNLIKDKKNKKLYQTLYYHLTYIETLNNLDELENHLNNMKSYLNGYTSKDKIFKNLRKVHLNNLYLNTNYFIDFINYKMKLIQNLEITQFNDLNNYAINTSKLGYLLLITNKNNNLNLEAIKELSIIDSLSYILLNYNDLLLNNKIHFAKQDIKDFNLIKDKNGYVINLSLLSLWNRISKKVKDSLNNYKKAIIFFDDCLILLINDYLSNVTKSLNDYSHKTFSFLAE